MQKGYIRKRAESQEHSFLCESAAFSDESRGRKQAEEPCDYRTCYQRDRDRIVHSSAFRRLKQKTQVFLSPQDDHYRTRLTHTYEVSQIARTLARALMLNEDLTEAIALGHDLGHTPFGHAGERVLNSLNPNGFRHYEQSVRVVSCIEKNGSGLNLSWEVLNGIVNHTKGDWPATDEGILVRYSDRIAYMNHDIEDAFTAGVLKQEDLPKDVLKVLGNTKSQRITTLIGDIINSSNGADIKMTPVVHAAYLSLHSFMYNTVYVDEVAKREEKKVGGLISVLYEHFTNRPEEMPALFLNIAQKEGTQRAVTDYISSMSDELAIKVFERVFVPQKWHVLSDIY